MHTLPPVAVYRFRFTSARPLHGEPVPDLVGDCEPYGRLINMYPKVVTTSPAPPLISQVAQEAVFLVQADFILMAYLAPDRRLMDLVTSALCGNREHWSADVRNASDQTFDLMLDYL